MIRLLIGGSPCTHWSIAQSKNRETQPSGIGWELFHNYEIAMQKFKPDYFLYENNVSAAAPIKAAIKASLGVDAGTAEYIEINSALVSAQTSSSTVLRKLTSFAYKQRKRISPIPYNSAMRSTYASNL